MKKLLFLLLPVASSVTQCSKNMDINDVKNSINDHYTISNDDELLDFVMEFLAAIRLWEEKKHTENIQIDNHDITCKELAAKIKESMLKHKNLSSESRIRMASSYAEMRKHYL